MHQCNGIEGVEMKKQVFLLGTLILFSGCFETQVDVKTTVQRDGTVVRETHIDGRGANLFKAPAGPGWQSKTYETKGEEAFLAGIYYHVESHGRFAPGQLIPSDYEFDIAKQAQSWGDKEKSRLKIASIKTPYEENLFSRNRVKINTFKGWFTVTTFYEEIFQNAGVIDVLLLDLKEEVRKQSLSRGENFEETELAELARIRLVDEILPAIRFRSEVSLPGKIVSSNAKKNEKGRLIWEFSMKDFGENYSIYTLKGASKSLRLPSIIFLLGTGLFGFAVLVLITLGLRLRQNQKKGPRRRPRNGADNP